MMALTYKCPHCGKEEVVHRPKSDLPDLFKSWAVKKYPAMRDTIMKWLSWKDVPIYLREQYRKEQRERTKTPDR